VCWWAMAYMMCDVDVFGKIAGETTLTLAGEGLKCKNEQELSS
jgi:hypothetical protein